MIIESFVDDIRNETIEDIPHTEDWIRKQQVLLTIQMYTQNIYR